MTFFLLALLVLSPGQAGAIGDPAWAAQAARLERRVIPGLSAEEIEVYIEKDDAWSAPVLKALPAFAAVGRSAFADRLPRVSLYLMSDEQNYRAFTKSVFGEERVTGTGNLHIVTMCLPCEKRNADEPETTAVVLHEFGHAWLNSYLRDHYDLDYLSDAIRRPYLDEGLADFFARRWDQDFLARRRTWIVNLKAGRSVAAPSLRELQSYESFYDKGDRELHYWISALLVERMLGSRPRAVRKIASYLDLVGHGHTPERAWEISTGKSLSTEYAALVSELWTGREAK